MMTSERIAALRELADYNNGHLDHILFVECLNEIERLAAKVSEQLTTLKRLRVVRDARETEVADLRRILGWPPEPRAIDNDLDGLPVGNVDALAPCGHELRHLKNMWRCSVCGQMHSRTKHGH